MNTPHHDDELQESSTNFDMENVRPFLQRISPLIESGFGPEQIEQVCRLAERMKHDDEQELEFPIRYGGRDALMRVGIFMDDINSPDVCILAPPMLAEQIDVEIENFFDELGT